MKKPKSQDYKNALEYSKAQELFIEHQNKRIISLLIQNGQTIEAFMKYSKMPFTDVLEYTINLSEN